MTEPKDRRGEGLVFAVCFCPGSLHKLGGPSIEPDPWKHPNCPQCGKPGKIIAGLGELSREIMLHAIDKCIWWPEHLKDNVAGMKTTRDWAGACERILIHLQAGRSRVSEGGPFDSYSTTC